MAPSEICTSGTTLVVVSPQPSLWHGKRQCDGSVHVQESRHQQSPELRVLVAVKRLFASMDAAVQEQQHHSKWAASKPSNGPMPVTWPCCQMDPLPIQECCSFRHNEDHVACAKQLVLAFVFEL